MNNNIRLIRFERLNLKNKRPKRPKGSVGRPGMVRAVLKKVDGPFTVKDLEQLARDNGLAVPVRASTLISLRRLNKMGFIRVVGLIGRSNVYLKIIP